MRQFPNIRKLSFYWGQEFETDERPICFVIEHGYDSIEDMLNAKASPVREAMNPALEEMMSLFKGRVYHVNHELDSVL